MLSFENDYSEGAHPLILEALAKSNLEQQPGYGMDEYSRRAAEKIRKACGSPDADIFFLTGGTAANQLVIDTVLQPYEGVISAETGHVNVHEAGAIEFTGHKVIALPQKEGKICASDVEAYLMKFYADEAHEHMVFPGMVYISWPTEFGTLYSRDELQALRNVTEAYHLPLYIDGARLGYGLMSPGNDLTLPEIAALSDVFYIGGTKVGALIGEAVVFPKGNAPKHFITMLKQHGDMLAKGRLTGIQFDVLFTDELYMKVSSHAIRMAEKLKEILRDRDCRFYLDSPTNQQFIVITNEEREKLSEKIRFSFWEQIDPDHCVIRLAVSWATTEEQLEALAAILSEVLG